MNRVCYYTLGFAELNKQLFSRRELKKKVKMHNAKENVWGWEVDFTGARGKRDQIAKLEPWQITQFKNIWSEKEIFSNWKVPDQPFPGSSNWFCRVIDRRPWFDDAKKKGGCPEMAGLRNDDKIIITCHGNVDEDYCNVHYEDAYTNDYGWNLRSYIPIGPGQKDIEDNVVKYDVLADLIANNVPDSSVLSTIRVTLSMCLMGMSSEFNMKKSFGYKFAKSLSVKCKRDVEVRCRATALMTPDQSDMQEALGIHTAGSRLGVILDKSWTSQLIEKGLNSLNAFENSMFNLIFHGRGENIKVQNAQDERQILALQKQALWATLSWCASNTGLPAKRQSIESHIPNLLNSVDVLDLTTRLDNWINDKKDPIHTVKHSFWSGAKNNSLEWLKRFRDAISKNTVLKLPSEISNRYVNRSGQRWFDMRQITRLCENLLYWIIYESPGNKDTSYTFTKMHCEVCDVINQLNHSNFIFAAHDIMDKWIGDNSKLINHKNHDPKQPVDQTTNLRKRVVQMMKDLKANRKVDAWFSSSIKSRTAP